MTTHERFEPDLPTTARLRAGDADRERTADELRRAHADGRIDADELAERIGRCYGARTFGELQRLTADLLTPERHRSLRRFEFDHGHQLLRIALTVIAALWALAFVAGTGAAAGHHHPHPSAFLVVLVFAFLVTRLIRAVRA